MVRMSCFLRKHLFQVLTYQLQAHASEVIFTKTWSSAPFVPGVIQAEAFWKMHIGSHMVRC